jgi:prepilin-type N-terminal cleavage/methylation domain-containing protein
MRDRGVTLVELLVVIAIVGILVIALGFSYQGWQGAYKVEKATKDIYTDLMDARTRAMTQGRAYFVDFPAATMYRMSMDDSNGVAKINNGDGVFQPQANPAVVTANTDTTLPTFPKTVEYTITWNAGGTITLNQRGIISTPGTICLTTTAAPDYDCIVISQTRINMGRLTTQISAGGACDAANCVAK